LTIRDFFVRPEVEKNPNKERAMRDKIVICVPVNSVRRAEAAGVLSVDLLYIMENFGGESVQSGEEGISGIFQADRKKGVLTGLGVLIGGIEGVIIQMR